MNHRRAAVLAWALFALWVVIAAVGVWLEARYSAAGQATFALLLVGYAFVGALVSARHPSNAVGWLLLAIPLAIGLSDIGDAYVRSESLPGYVAVAWVMSGPGNALLLIAAILPLIFPDGRLLSRRWRLVLWIDIVALVAGIVGPGLKPGELAVSVSIENPLGVHGSALAVVKAVDRLFVLASLLGVLLAAASMVVRFHRSVGAERQQLKWFAYAAFTAIAGFLVAGLGEVLPPAVGDPVGGAGWAVFLGGFVVGVPAATGVAILRFRLYDIDLVINRTLVYGSLTVALAATYVVSTLVLRAVLSPFTGKSDLAVAISTLAVAAVFRPARARIQTLVDRRFYRSRYDAVHTLEQFSSRLRQELDLDAVGADLLTTAVRTMQPAHVSLWLRDAAGARGRRPRMS